MDQVLRGVPASPTHDANCFRTPLCQRCSPTHAWISLDTTLTNTVSPDKVQVQAVRDNLTPTPALHWTCELLPSFSTSLCPQNPNTPKPKHSHGTIQTQLRMLLSYPQPDAPTCLMTDASDTAVLQQNINGKWNPISFFSRKMTPAESRLWQLGVYLLSIKQFRHFLEATNPRTERSNSQHDTSLSSPRLSGTSGRHSADALSRIETNASSLANPLRWPWRHCPCTPILTILNSHGSPTGLNRPAILPLAPKDPWFRNHGDELSCHSETNYCSICLARHKLRCSTRSCVQCQRAPFQMSSTLTWLDHSRHPMDRVDRFTRWHSVVGSRDSGYHPPLWQTTSNLVPNALETLSKHLLPPSIPQRIDTLPLILLGIRTALYLRHHSWARWISARPLTPPPESTTNTYPFHQ